MADNWESVADEVAKIVGDVNKWQGEDVDDDVKDSWEDEEEKKDEEKSESKATVPTKTKSSNVLKAKLTEEERLAEEEEEKRLANLTPEEKKLRLKKIQEESDLKSALEIFGVPSVGPQTKEEFKEFGATLSWALSQYKESTHFPQFVEDLVRSICVNLSAADIKKVKINVDSLHTEKLKMEKQNAKKPAGKGKAKATLRTETDDIDGYQKYGNDYAEDYDDDFM